MASKSNGARNVDEGGAMHDGPNLGSLDFEECRYDATTDSNITIWSLALYPLRLGGNATRR
jgi:hypothetical protein